MSLVPAELTITVCDDLLTVCIHGSLSLTMSKEIYGKVEGVLFDKQYCLVLFDLRKASLPSQESRIFIAHWFQKA